MSFIVIIPARYASSRLPAKLLKDVYGKPLIQLAYENAIKSQADRVIIATDDMRIKQAVQGFGAQVCMTDSQHTSGTSRIAQVLSMLNIADDECIVNVQGDEPMLDPIVINQVANNLLDSQMHMATLCEPVVDEQQYLDPNCVKVVFDKLGKALYFSRAPIPFFRERQDIDLSLCYKHIGIYAYHSRFIKQYLTMDSARLEQVERLEQLTILYEGFDVHVANACSEAGFGIDTPEDLNRLLAVLAPSKNKG